VIDAFHLPALEQVPTTPWSYGRGEDAVELRIPQLTPAMLRIQTEALVDGQQRLEARSVFEIVAAVDHVANRFLDPSDPLRRTAESALPAITGYSPAMVDRVLDGMAADWRSQRLIELLHEEFGDPGVLDGLRPRRVARGYERAYGPRLVTHIFSGNVPGVGVTSLIRSLLVKSGTLGKTAAGEPLLPALFARALAEHDAELGRSVAVTYWPGGDFELEQVALAAAEAVIVYGSGEAVSAVRNRAPPESRFLGYGHKLSFGLIGSEVLREDDAGAVAAAAALEVATFDQQGCVSPHLFYVEEGGAVSPQGWAGLLASAMERVEGELPRGTVSPREAATIRQLRGEAEFGQLGGGGVELHASGEGTLWTVIYDPDPTFSASCLNRLVRVKPVSSLENVPLLIEAIGPLLQSIGIAASDDRRRALAASLGRLGASRIAPIGRMAFPPPAWHHDGHPPLRDLVRWCDVEEADAVGPAEARKPE
jgi:hypothetical protein